MKVLKTEETTILVKIMKTYSYAYKQREYREYSKLLQGQNLETVDLLYSLSMNIQTAVSIDRWIYRKYNHLEMQAIIFEARF